MDSQTPSRTAAPVRSRGSMIAVLAAALLALVAAGVAMKPRAEWTAYKPQEGDVIFQSLPRNEVVNCIEGATESPWSHCGLVAKDGDAWVVYEALGDVHKTPLQEFYARGRDGRFSICRLKAELRGAIPKVVEQTKSYVGRPYDTRYRMEDDEIYCSELIFKAYRTATGENLGKTVTLGQLKWRPYRTIIEHLEGGPAPLDREMITPRDLAAAEQLERVTGYEPPLRK